MKLPVFKDPVTDAPSFSITVAAVTFTVVLVKWMIGGTTFAGKTWSVVSMDEVRGWLDPTLIFYAVRQGTKVAESFAIAKVEKTP